MLNLTRAAAPLLALSFLALAGCAGPGQDAASLSASPFSVGPPAADLARPGDPVLVRFWSVECTDPDAPELNALLESQGHTGFDAAELADRLDAMHARGILNIRSRPAITVRDGQSAEIAMTTPVNPRLMPGLSPEEAAHVDLGETIDVVASVDADRAIVIDLDYILTTAGPDAFDEPLPSLLSTRIQRSLKTANGRTHVLGGQRVVREVAGEQPEESVLLLIVNARSAGTPEVPGVRAAVRD